MTIRFVAKGPRLSVTETLRELGMSKTAAEALARDAEKLADQVVPPAANAKRPAKAATKPAVKQARPRPPAKARARSAALRAA